MNTVGLMLPLAGEEDLLPNTSMSSKKKVMYHQLTVYIDPKTEDHKENKSKEAGPLCSMSLVLP